MPVQKNKCLNLFSSKFDSFITYSTDRSASIKSFKVGLVYRIAQILILAYIFGWELYHNKGYQIFDSVSSVVTTKVKGQGFIPLNSSIDLDLKEQNFTFLNDLYTLKSGQDYRMMDTADYIIPPNEYNSIFIMTNFLKTKQHQDKCPEESTKFKAKCNEDGDCLNLGSALNSWNGIPTGKCVHKNPGSDLKVCEIFAWCPVEDENIRTEDSLVRNVLNFTIFIKNDIEFKKFGKKIRNIQPYHTNKYLQTCEYHLEKDPYCPIFQLNYIIGLAENDPSEVYQMLIKGGVILVEIIWNCDFDFQSSCLPEYQFHRFDSRQTDTASGFNFRFANRFRENDQEVRELYKAYGLRLIINVSGTGGKFNIVPLMLTIGAGIGLMSISVILADCVLLNFTKKKRFYQEIKELDIDQILDTNIRIARL